MTLAATIQANEQLWNSIKAHFSLLYAVKNLPLLQPQTRHQVEALQEAFRVLLRDGCEEGEAIFEHTMRRYPWLERFRAGDRYDLPTLQQQAYTVTETALAFCGDVEGVPAYTISSLQAELETTRLTTLPMNTTQRAETITAILQGQRGHMFDDFSNDDQLKAWLTDQNDSLLRGLQLRVLSAPADPATIWNNIMANSSTKIILANTSPEAIAESERRDDALPEPPKWYSRRYVRCDTTELFIASGSTAKQAVQRIEQEGIRYRKREYQRELAEAGSEENLMKQQKHHQ